MEADMFCRRGSLTALKAKKVMSTITKGTRVSKKSMAAQGYRAANHMGRKVRFDIGLADKVKAYGAVCNQADNGDGCFEDAVIGRGQAELIFM